MKKEFIFVLLIIFGSIILGPGILFSQTEHWEEHPDAWRYRFEKTVVESEKWVAEFLGFEPCPKCPERAGDWDTRYKFKIENKENKEENFFYLENFMTAVKKINLYKDRLVISGELGSYRGGFTVVDLNQVEIIDEVSGFYPVFSPKKQYILFKSFVPRGRFPNTHQITEILLFYDLDNPPEFNRTGKDLEELKKRLNKEEGDGEIVAEALNKKMYSPVGRYLRLNAGIPLFPEKAFKEGLTNPLSRVFENRYSITNITWLTNTDLFFTTAEFSDEKFRAHLYKVKEGNEFNRIHQGLPYEKVMSQKVEEFPVFVQAQQIKGRRYGIIELQFPKATAAPAKYFQKEMKIHMYSMRKVLFERNWNALVVFGTVFLGLLLIFVIYEKIHTGNWSLVQNTLRSIAVMVLVLIATNVYWMYELWKLGVPWG